MTGRQVKKVGSAHDVKLCRFNRPIALGHVLRRLWSRMPRIFPTRTLLTTRDMNRPGIQSIYPPGDQVISMWIKSKAVDQTEMGKHRMEQLKTAIEKQELPV